MDSNEKLFSDLQNSAKNNETFQKVLKDFSTTFERLGIGENSNRFAKFVLDTILSAKDLLEAEQIIKSFFEKEKVNDKTVFDIIQDSLHERIRIIFEQVEQYLKDASGKGIDYGCGSGMLTQLLHDSLKLDIEGVDVRDFRSSIVSIPINVFNGYKVPVKDKYYDYAVLTNVIHHEFDNEKILEELDRIVSKKLVIIETVPEANDEHQAKQDWGRMILNDALWNRFFNYANIPVPGTYETPFTWIKRFEKYGWKCTYSEDLGFDQPAIQDRHHLLVFER